MLFVTNSIQIVQQIPYPGSSYGIWTLQNRTSKNIVKYADDLLILPKE
jgi:hypothetical protein